MKTAIACILTGFGGCALSHVIFTGAYEYQKERHSKEIQRLTDSLAKCNGITARVNKDSTYYIKQKNR